jgi:hypothetical protein
MPRPWQAHVGASRVAPQTPLPLEYKGLCGTYLILSSCLPDNCAAQPAAVRETGRTPMHGIIYLVGLIVVIMAILSFLGLR